MSIQRFAEKWDATRGIPRPTDAPHLTPYHALLRCVRDGMDMLHLVLCGLASAWLFWIAARKLEVSAEVQLGFVAVMLVALLVGFMEASQLLLPYFRISQRISRGSALWADVSWLKEEGFVPSISGQTERGQLRLGTLTTGHDLVLPPSHTLRHLALFGPPGSGKSATFLMTFLRDWAHSGSVIVLDPKGELYEQTAADYKEVFRLDLQDPSLSDTWNFLPACHDTEFAHEVASIVVGLDETRHSTDSDKFWQVSEVAALTSILLHLSKIVDHPTPPMINEFIANRDLDAKPGETLSPMEKEMRNSPQPDARLYWGTFSKAKREVQGGILTGLAVKCAPFSTPNVKKVTSPNSDLRAKIIDLKLLRQPGTAIYVVIPEGDASRYSTLRLSSALLWTRFEKATSILRPYRRSLFSTRPATFLFMD